MREHDPALVFALDFDHLQVQPVVLVRRLLGAVFRRQSDALERELDVVGGHFAEPVREHLSRFQTELDDGRRDLLDLGRRIELELGRIRLLRHQPLEDGAHDIALPRPGAVRGVEHGEIAVDAHGDAGARPGLGRRIDRIDQRRTSEGRQEVAAIEMGGRHQSLLEAERPMDAIGGRMGRPVAHGDRSGGIRQASSPGTKPTVKTGRMSGPAPAVACGSIKSVRGKFWQRYFVVGIMNSAPARMPDGQRCVTAFCRV